MSNEALLVASLIIPWFTLFFMRRREIKRYMPAALLGALLTTVVGEVALALEWWRIQDAIFPFYHVPIFTYGGFLVGILWIFKLSFGRFAWYLAINAVFNWGLAYGVNSLLGQRGIFQLVNISPFQLFMLNMLLAVVLYSYQLWQEEVLETPLYSRTSISLHPAAAKLLTEKAEEEEKNS